MAVEPHRRDRMTALADLRSGVGLEIGPLHRTVAAKSEYDVRYVDVFDTESIRNHYRGVPGVDLDDIPELDFWLRRDDGEIVGLDEAAKESAPYRWVIASHVIEHVPDVIGWFGQLAQIMDDDASLVLCIPDRRFSFDAMRPPTTVGQLLQAHEAGDKSPSVRAVYDHHRNAVTLTSAQLWAGRQPTDDDRVHVFAHAVDQFNLARDEGQYIDCHVWLFTPTEFVAQIADLSLLNLVDFYIDRIIPTAPDDLEFYALLKRIPRGLSAADVAERRAASILQYTEPDVAPPAAAESAPSRPAGADDPGVPNRPAGPGASWFEASPLEIRLMSAKRRVINFVMRRR